MSIETKKSASADREPSGRWSRVKHALDERLGLSAVRYPVPRHANALAWTLGGLTLASLVILIVTGILLAQFYTPTPEAARESVLHIETQLQLGSFLRGIHIWAAQAMFVLIFAHLARVLITGSYKRPREANWLIGLGLLAMTYLLLFTGSTLRWDQEAFEAVEHNTGLANLAGGLGTWFTAEFGSGTPLVTRLYLAHVSFLPALIFLLLVIHFALVKYHGVSPRSQVSVGEPDHDEEVPFTSHVRHLTGWSLILLAILMGLAATTVNPIGAAPVAGIEVTKPMWPFFWVYQIENWMGLQGLFWAPIAVFVALAALPFLDRRPERRPSRRRWVMISALILFGGWSVLTLMVAVSGTASHLG